MRRPTARVLRRIGLGFLLGAVGGWVTGLLRPHPVAVPAEPAPRGGVPR